MITDVPGILVGQYTDEQSITGCSVILCPPGTVGNCEVRGSSAGSRDLTLLAPKEQMQEVHAILLSGGSAYGLGAANGVMKYLAERQVGYKTPWAIVPTVSQADIFDLNIGSSAVFPTDENAYTACMNVSTIVDQGSVGAGTGAVVGKWNGFEKAMKGGVGSSSLRKGELVVGAFAVVNAVGDIINADGSVIAGANVNGKYFSLTERLEYFQNERLLSHNTNTTLVVVASNAKLGKSDTFRVLQRMHDGMSHTIHPCHTAIDGDVSFALSTGEVIAPIDFVAELAAEAVSHAIRNAVRAARGRGGVKGLMDI